MFKLRPLFWPTVISLPILVFSLALGAWQMERREWKRDILDRIAHNQAAPAVGNKFAHAVHFNNFVAHLNRYLLFFWTHRCNRFG